MRTRVQVRDGAGGLEVTVHGDLDGVGTARLRDALAGVYGRRAATVVVDLGGVRQVSLAALAALVAARRWCVSTGGALLLRDVALPVRRMLAASGLHRVFPVLPRGVGPTPAGSTGASAAVPAVALAVPERAAV